MPTLLQAAQRAGLDLDQLPQHVAIIMDGNGRWATGKGLGRLLGHREGYKTLKSVVEAAGELGVKFLTVYAFSAENWRRPQSEVAGLMKLIEGAMREQTQHLVNKNVRVAITGRMHELPVSLREALEEGIAATRHCTGMTFCLAINYGGRA
ncbi:MAG: di-trans,poly-cis-decaprenylcistransferase, partial [Candidatus Hydrogenedentes bacterium]|nr:di-trans,poly-cis-decaprenylcistransferase [Candidatus Hydrogenedentota bacterium]